MNTKLKRMFEDDDCSREEAELHAAILGKSYEECKKDWELQFKKEYILANANVILEQGYIANGYCSDAYRKYSFKLITHYASDLKSKILKCDNVIVENDFVTRPDFNTEFGPTYITVSFYEYELDDAFIIQVRKKILKYIGL